MADPCARPLGGPYKCPTRNYNHSFPTYKSISNCTLTCKDAFLVGCRSGRRAPERPTRALDQESAAGMGLLCFVAGPLAPKRTLGASTGPPLRKESLSKGLVPCCGRFDGWRSFIGWGGGWDPGSQCSGRLFCFKLRSQLTDLAQAFCSKHTVCEAFARPQVVRCGQFHDFEGGTHEALTNPSQKLTPSRRETA